VAEGTATVRHPSSAPPPFVMVSRDVLVATAEVVAVVDARALESAPTREFVGFARRRGQVEDLSEGERVKSLVVCRRRVLLSPLASSTLRRRLRASRPPAHA
jgi:regulator of extracellular matrix RemA (YlzA/DUF370 family)